MGGLSQSRNYEGSDNGVGGGGGGSVLTYKSKFHDLCREEDREFKESYHKRKKQKLEGLKRIHEYSMNIKEMIRGEQEGGKRLSESVDIINPKYSSPFRD